MHQDQTKLLRVEPRVEPADVPQQIGNLAGGLHAGIAPADHHEGQQPAAHGPGEKRTVCASRSTSSTAPRKMEAPRQNLHRGLTTWSGEIDEPLTSASIGWKSMTF